MSFSTMVNLKGHVKKSHSQRITNDSEESAQKYIDKLEMRAETPRLSFVEVEKS
jgi:hypothetical protein